MKNLIWVIFTIIFIDVKSQTEIGLTGKQFLALSTSSADSVSAWYEEIFQLKLLKEFRAPDGSGYVRIIGNEHLIIEILQHKNSKSLQDCAVSSEQPYLMRGFFKVACYVKDVTLADKYLRSKHVVIRNPIFVDNETRSKSLIITDCMQKLIQVIEDQPGN